MPNVFTSVFSSIPNAWRWIAANKDSLTISFALIAGATALYQYLESVDDTRRKETLKYVDRFQESRVGQARGAVAMVLLDSEKRKSYDLAVNAASTVPKNVQALDNFVSENKLERDLIILTEHFMNLAGCVKARICDKGLACDFFVSDIQATNNSFRQLFDTVWKERTGQNYMAGPLEFVASCSTRRWPWQ